ncbi:MAG: aldehyde dehydrogenase family protein [Lachnospiraceae bacterium]
MGEWLTADERIAGVNFTGSTAAGRRVAENCGRNLKYQSLELGGNAPMIVCADADIDAAVAEATACRAFYMAGQICSVPKRFIVHRSVHDEFLEKLLAKVKTVKLGDPMDPETTIGHAHQ